jgi:hypothetical protein
MNWIRENKFLSGFIAVMIIGAGALLYLLYSAYGAYSDITDQYNAAANDLHKYQTQVPYPDETNLAKYRSERDDLVDATHNLAASLSQMVLPVENLTPSAFQDRLRETVSAVIAKAGQAGVKLPDHFAMDFDQYQTQPPVAAAAGPLGRQLTALQIVMNILIDEHVDSILSLVRTRLPQETGAAASHAGGGFGHRGPEGASSGSGDLVEKIPFEIRFVANQPAFQKVINDLAASSKQFFITRTLVVDNTNPKPVSKGEDAATPAAPASPAEAFAPPGSPDTSGTTSYLKFIVGTEELSVAMRVDMVAFNPPEKSSRPGAGPAH